MESIIKWASEFIEDFNELNDFEKRNEVIDFAKYSINRIKKDSLVESYFYHNCATIQNEQGLYGKALKFYFKSLNISKEILGENDLLIFTLYNNIGLVYDNKNHRNEKSRDIMVSQYPCFFMLKNIKQ